MQGTHTHTSNTGIFTRTNIVCETNQKTKQKQNKINPK